MIQTNKKRAIVAERPIRDDLKLWLSGQDAFKIAIAEKDYSVLDRTVSDAIIFLRGREKTDVDQVETLNLGISNRHRNWHNAGKPLKDWSDGTFHMGDPLIMATWLCGKAGVEEILFAELKPESRVQTDYNKRAWKDVMERLMSEFGIEMFYTDLRSQMFKEIGAQKMEGFMEEPEPRNVQLPTRESPFEYRRVTDYNPTVKYREDAIGPTVIHGGERFTATDLIPSDTSRLPEPNLFILRPDHKLSLKKAIGTGKDLYLLNEDVAKELTGQSSVLVRTALAFAIGEESVHTEGIIDRVSDSEQEYLQGMAKNNENISHA